MLLNCVPKNQNPVESWHFLNHAPLLFCDCSCWWVCYLCSNWEIPSITLFSPLFISTLWPCVCMISAGSSTPTILCAIVLRKVRLCFHKQRLNMARGRWTWVIQMVKVFKTPHWSHVIFKSQLCSDRQTSPYLQWFLHVSQPAKFSR